MAHRFIFIVTFTFFYLSMQAQSNIESLLKRIESPEEAKDSLANEKIYAISLLTMHKELTALTLAHGNIKQIHVKAYDASVKFGKVEKNVNTLRVMDMEIFDDSIRLTYKTPDKAIEERYKFGQYGIAHFSIYRNKRFQKKHILSFDEKGNNTEINVFDSRKKLCGKSTYTYNKKGLCVTKNSYDNRGALVEQREFKYNRDNRIAEQTKTQKDKINVTTNFFYNRKGYCVQRDDIEKDDTTSTIFQYDNRNNCISKVTPDESVTFCYDNRDNVIEDLSFFASGEFNNRLDISYEYDARGNWTRLICVSEFTETGVIYERQISYNY